MQKVVTKLSDYTQNKLSDLLLSDIATIIRKDWRKTSKNGIDYAAKEYLEAMDCLSTIKDKYIMDSGKEIIIRFLINASTWKGTVAKEVKAYLKSLK